MGRRFTVLAAGLLLTVLGSALTSLAMGAWVFQATGSATLYGITLLANLVPGVLFGPVAGALVDRWNRRTVLFGCEVVSAGTIIGLLAVERSGGLEPWHIFVTVGIQSLIRAMQVPALNSAVVLLAPRERVPQATGFVMLCQSLGNTLGFALGGVLLVTVELTGVLLLDLATFVVNMAILLAISIPRPERSEAGTAVDGAGLLAEIRAGWKVLATRRALVTLLLFGATLNLGLGLADTVMTPLVLSFASAAALGMVIAAMGVGAIVGSTAMAIWGGPRRRVVGLAGFALPLGLFLVLGSLRADVVLIAIAAFGFSICFTMVDATTRTILQLEVEPDVQGRVFSTYNVVSGAALCVSYVLAGPVADFVFEPLLMTDGPLAGTVGAVIGTGPGRGMALLMMLIGLLLLVTSGLAYLQPSLRALPDRPERRAPEHSEHEHVVAEDTVDGVPVWATPAGLGSRAEP
jgi:DHA3 family macrolide efflux protein-like MFS transporter